MSETFKILIAYDGSDCADAALEDLSSAGLPEKEVEALIVGVAEVWLPPNGDSDDNESDFMTEGLRKKLERNLRIFEESKQLTEKAGERVRRDFAGWDVRTESTYGSPAWEILVRAETFKSDLIIVGSQGLSMIQRIWLGSISQKIVTESKCSVRVVRGESPTAGAPVRLVVGFDGTEGSAKAAEAVINRFWPAESEVHIIIVEDNETVLEAFSPENENNQLKVRGEEIVRHLQSKDLKASLQILNGNPKNLLIQHARDFQADCIFVGATKYTGAMQRFLLGSVSSAVTTRAGCTVEVVR